jgi:hypothetical protein
MSKEVLDQFGKLVIKYVRDWSIDETSKLVHGKQKSCKKSELDKYLASLPSETKNAIDRFIPVVVDTTLHYFLFLIEGNPNLDLIMKSQDGIHSIKKESDGLSGEIYTDMGWIEQYSSHERNEQE